MTTHDVAKRLVELCRQGKNVEAINELYADHIISFEPEGNPHGSKVEGKQAVLAKTQGFLEAVKEFHHSEISEPIVAGNHFACTMSMDVTMKDGTRNPMEEVCVYEVSNGKITKEQFFFPVNVPQAN